MSTLDELIPKPRLLEIDEVTTAATPATALEIARHFDLASSPLVGALFWLRTVPERLASGQSLATPPDLRLDAIGRAGEGFHVLEDAPDRLIVGAIGRFWQSTIEFAPVSPREFAAFDRPGWGKVAWELRSEPVGAGSRLVFELRVTATDDESWHAQERYFRLIGPFSRFIRRHELQLIARELGGRLDGAAQRELSGDDFIATPKAALTQVTVIDAPPRSVWPWLVQMGCRRAGWYSYDLLDNAGMQSEWQVVPELQGIAEGDVLPMKPDDSAGFSVLAIDEPHALVLGGLWDAERDVPLPMAADKPEHFWQSTWAFVLEPLAGDRTRLWVRVRVDYGPERLAARLRVRALGLVHRFMESRQLKNLKLRAEGGERPAHSNLADVAHATLGAAGIVFDLATPFLRGVRCHWGLSAEQAARSYPGDELIPEPRWQWTHAVEIDAPPERVWPWVAQLGQDKAGFYSYQALENLVGCEIHNANRIHPEWTSPRLGDALRLHPEAPPLTVHEVRPSERLLVSAGLDPATGKAPQADTGHYVAVIWLFQLEPLPDARTRLISRYRCACSGELATRLAYGPYIAESVGFVMDRRMLLGIQERAERPSP
ncbi:MAG TPA: hypothetical protein VJR89_38105 [Polyangiales bacterium]|nr:hypothetical protein [Polyangiales bacterium]